MANGVMAIGIVVMLDFPELWHVCEIIDVHVFRKNKQGLRFVEVVELSGVFEIITIPLHGSDDVWYMSVRNIPDDQACGACRERRAARGPSALAGRTDTLAGNWPCLLR